MILPAMEVARLRAAWQESPRPAVVSRGFVRGADCARVRDSLEASAPPERWLGHHGRYASVAEHDVPDIVRACRAAAESVAGERLAIDRVRLVRFGPRGYQLPADDPPSPERCIEVTLDASASATGGAELVYCASQRPFFVISQRPGTLSIVARRPDTQRYVRYLDHSLGEVRVYRLELLLAPA